MMATHSSICRTALIVSLVLFTVILKITAEEKRWSRQISNAGFLNDWIPVQPQAQQQQQIQPPARSGGRVLNFGPPFGAGPNEFNQQSPSIVGASATTNLGEPFQRIFLQQMHPPNLPILPQNQQQLHVTNLQSAPFRHLQSGLHEMQLNAGPQHYILQHPQPELQTQQFRYPQYNPPAPKPEFIRHGESSLQQSPQQQQLIQSEPPQLKNNVLENQQPSLEMQALPPQEEVQLLYVPLDTLYNQQQDKLQNTRYNILPSPVNPLQINNFYTHHQKFPASTVAPPGAPFKITTSAAKLRTTTSKPLHRFSFNTVTESPKPKSHQPPLAMFMKNSLSISNSPSVNDILSHLIYTRSIDVVDSVGGTTPSVFIGPHGLSTPDGYSKFELPYLSALEQTRSDRQINMLPFFVAPLSYRAPKNFAKIPLPSPHVGSIVVNTPNGIPSVNNFDEKPFFADAKLQPTTTRKPVQHFSYTTPAPAPERSPPPGRTTSRFRFGPSELSRPTYHSYTQNEPDVISTTTPSSLTSFSTFKSTPTYKAQTDGLFQQSNANDSDEPNYHFGNKYHTTGIFATAPPPKQHSTIDNFRLKDDGPSKYSLTNSQQPINTTAFAFIKNEEPQSVFGNFFTQTPTASFFNTPEPIFTTKVPVTAKFQVNNFDEPQRYNPFLSSTPAPTSPTAASSITAAPARDEQDDIEKMKSYFREQEAFKLRNPIAISTPAAYFESSSAGTIATEKGYNEFSTIPSKLNYFSKEPKQHASNAATTPRTTVTYYTASSASDGSAEQDVPRIKGHAVHQFRFVDSVLQNNKDDNRIQTTSKPDQKYNSHESLQYNEIYNTSPQFETTRTPYRERPTVSPLDENTATYHIPSELSVISSNLPGLVNGLMEKDGNTTPYVTAPTTSTVPLTTRRSPVSARVRTRPPTTSRTHLADDGSVPEITTRRTTRGRRPINYANRTSSVRTTTARSPNRVRFNTATEERARASTRTRTRVNNRPAKEEENIDYQRDVLKQNYPILSKQNGTKSVETNIDQPNRLFSYVRETTIAPLPPFDQVKVEKNVEVSYSEKESTVPDKYFGFRDDGSRIQNQLLQKEPESPQFVSTTTFTSIQNDDNQEEITEVLKTRKPSFIRRVPSTTARSVTTQRNGGQSEYDASRTKERNSVRQKNWQQTDSSSSAPRVAKPRIRNKRPFIATTTVNPTTEVNTDQPFQQINSFNKDFYKESAYSKKTANDTKSTSEKRKNQFRFSLNAEESQWSTKFNANSFQPIGINEKPKVSLNSPEVEIVTAAPMSDADKETYSFNVQANFFDYNKNKENDTNSVTTTTTTTAPITTTTTIAQSSASEVNNIDPDTMIYDNELSKINVNHASETEENTVHNSNPQHIDQKAKFNGTPDDTNTKQPEKKGRRRGVWKRVRVRPIDSFETAESQNIGKQLYNTILSDNIKEFGERNNNNNKKSTSQHIISSPSAYAYEETLTFSDDTNESQGPIGDNSSDDEFHTILPIQPTEQSKFAEFDATTIENDSVASSEDTTEPIEKDERELEATSTVIYDESDDLTTTVMPFDIKKADKFAEQAKTSPTPPLEKSGKIDGDQITEPTSIMDEVKQKLTELFSFEDDDDGVVVSTTERVFKINRNFKRPKAPLYTSIDRNPSVNDIANGDKDSSSKDVKSSPASMKLEPVPVLKTILRPITEPSSFHRELMDSVIYATSTSTEISHETEICYRGRCVKTQKKP